MCNQDIRNEVKRNGFALWQIAEKLGIADCNFSRKLRREFTDEEKQRIRGIIAELIKERELNV